MPAKSKSDKVPAEGEPGPTEPVTEVADHDRIVGLSIRKDGTLDQHNPEIIGDKETALDAAKTQFAQIAVAAVDAAQRPELGLAGSEPEQKQDASIAKLKKAHDAAIEEAEAKAEALVDALHKGE